MFREEKKPTHKQTINVLITDGGLGDLVCAIPAINYLIKTQHWLNPLIWIPINLIDFTKHFLPKDITVRDFIAAQKKFNEKLAGVTTRWLPHRTAMRTHPVDYAYQCLLDGYPYNPEMRNYPTIRASEIDVSHFDLPEKYVVLVGTAAEKVKTMPVETMNQIIAYVKSKGYEVVFVGSEKQSNGIVTREIPVVPIDFDAGVNLINKTTVLELAAVIQGAKLFIGMDGGPVHIAGFTTTPIVAGYTFASPDHLMPIRNNIVGYNTHPIVPDESLGCKFCQSHWSLLYGHDFRECYYQDFLCAKQMTFEKFKVGIDKFI